MNYTILVRNFDLRSNSSGSHCVCVGMGHAFRKTGRSRREENKGNVFFRYNSVRADRFATTDINQICPGHVDIFIISLAICFRIHEDVRGLKADRADLLRWEQLMEFARQEMFIADEDFGFSQLDAVPQFSCN